MGPNTAEKVKDGKAYAKAVRALISLPGKLCGDY